MQTMIVIYKQIGHYMYPDDTFELSQEVKDEKDLFLFFKKIYKKNPIWREELLHYSTSNVIKIDKEYAKELYFKWVSRINRTLTYIRQGKAFKPLVLNINFTCDEDVKYCDMILEEDRFIYYNGSYVIDPFVNKVKLSATDINAEPFIVFTHKQLTSALLETKGKLEKVLPNYFNLKPKEYLCYLIKDDKLILRKRKEWK